MFLNLLVIVLPALASANCPAGTFMFEQNSKCLSLADHCFNQNKLIRADLRGCGKKCERDEEPQIHTNKCINLHCKLYTNSGLNQEQRCVPCPEGMTTSEDGKSCVERSSWGECKLEAEKTRSVSCEGPFCDQIPSTETEECGDLMTKKLETLFLEMNMMKSKIEVQDRKISDLDKKISDLQRDNAIKDQKISTLQSDNLNIKERIAHLMSGKINIDQKISKLKTKITTLETEKDVQEDEITALGSRITTENKNLQGKLSKIENKPYAFQCAYQDRWTFTEGWAAGNYIITWDKFITNIMRGVTGGLSLSSGEFTVGHSGVWEVSYTMGTNTRREENTKAYLYINGSKLSESRYYTKYHSESEGYIISLGSRTLFIKLNKGDKVTLKTNDRVIEDLDNITLCFHLAQPFPVSDESVSEEISASVSHSFQLASSSKS